MRERVLNQGRQNGASATGEIAAAAPQHSQRVLKARTSPRSEPSSWRPSARLEAVEKYGRFEILGRIGRGGMAEILLARERSLVGGLRHLVIKRVLPEVREFDQMLHMFLDESRVVMGLSHPNLCQIYEVGEQEGAWFIAMEWVNGVTLHQLARRANELPDLDYRVVARVIAQCAEALHYAHAARDADGQLMKLVHRDVSPHNLIVAYDGRVKLLDFGIAKSTTTTHRTEAGVVKGKICYMAPEQWLSQPLDARTDVFALGICLYEALAGRMLFKRESQSEVMRAVLSGDVAPLSEVASEVPAALAAIAHRALQTEPELRFQSANEMAEALERFVASAGDPLSAAHVARYTRRLFRSEVQLGPVLERSARAAQFTPANELLLPPLPPSLFGMAVPRARSVPPPFACTPALVLPTAADPVWSDESEPGVETALLDVLEPRVPSVAPARDGESSTRRTIPSLPAPEPEPGARSAARTLSMRVGPGLRRAALAAALLLAVPIAWSASTHPRAPIFARAPEGALRPSAAMAQLATDGAPRVGAFPMPAFTLLPPTAPLTAAPARGQGESSRVEPRHLGKLSINTRPWSTVYLGSRLLGSTPLADVAVPRGALMLKLVDRDGRVHLRRIPASSRTERAAHFDF